MRFCRQNGPVFFKIKGLVRFDRPLNVSKPSKAALNRIKKGSGGETTGNGHREAFHPYIQDKKRARRSGLFGTA